MSDGDALRWRTSLAELETTATDVSPSDVPELAGRLEALKVRLVLRLQAPAAAPAGQKGKDRLLDAAQAAALLGVKKSWIFDHGRELSPARLPGSRLLRYRESRILRLIRTTLNSPPTPR